VIRPYDTLVPLRRFALGLLLGSVASLAVANQDFVVWSAYNVKFQVKPRKVYFLTSIYVLNPSHKEMRELTFTAKAPEGFSIELPPSELQEAYRRPDDFRESLDGGAYEMYQKYLGAGQATTLFYVLRFEGRPDVVDFPGLKIAYRSGEEELTFEVPSELQDMKKYGLFAGDLDDYIKRYAGMTFKLPEEPDFSFSARDSRAAATNPHGVIDVDGSPEGGGYFRIQAGFPGDFREMLVRWEPKKRGRKDPVTKEYALEQLEELIHWVGDFNVDPESLKYSDVKLARLPAVLIEGQWVDNKKARLGAGPFRLYVLNDPKTGPRDVILYLGAQGRGVGPDAADQPQPEKDAELIQELVGYAGTLKL
jgi:hypothetical protein